MPFNILLLKMYEFWLNSVGINGVPQGYIIVMPLTYFCHMQCEGMQPLCIPTLRKPIIYEGRAKLERKAMALCNNSRIVHRCEPLSSCQDVDLQGLRVASDPRQPQTYKTLQFSQILDYGIDTAGQGS